MLTIILSLFSSARQVFQTRLSNSYSAASSDSCPPTSAFGTPALQPWPSAALESRGSIPMGVARTILERLAIGISHRQARDCPRLASRGTSTVLQGEEAPSGRTTLRVAGGHRSDSLDELGESWLGRSSD